MNVKWERALDIPEELLDVSEDLIDRLILKELEDIREQIHRAAGWLNFIGVVVLLALLLGGCSVVCGVLGLGSLI